MRVLVTGLSHPLAPYLCEEAVRHGFEVRVVAEEGAMPAGVETVTGTLNDDAVLMAALRDVEIVYHTLQAPQRRDWEMQQVNAEGTRRMLEACAGDVKRFVFVGTPMVYAPHPTPDTWPVRADAAREAHGTPQLTSYAQSMIEAEDYVLEASAAYSMEYVLLRMATLFGRNLYVYGILTALMRNPARADQMNEIFGPMQWLHASDAARAALLAGTHEAARNQAFIIAGEQSFTVFDLLATAWDLTRMGEVNPFTATADARRPPFPKLDIGKIEQALGFRPALSLRDCVAELLRPSATAAPVPDMSGKTCVITGATSGIGLATAEQLAAMGARLILVGRDRAKGEAVLRRLRAAVPTLEGSMHYGDLSRLDGVRHVATEIRDIAPRIDVLINNAGAMFDRREVTEDGLERTFAINHMAHFLLTALLQDRLIASAPARVVTVASSGHYGVRLDFDDLQCERTFDRLLASKRSKLCNILFTRELARRLAGTGVTANCLCPGFVATGFGDNWDEPARRKLQRAQRLYAAPPEQGAAPVVWLASAPEVSSLTGRYFEKGIETPPSPEAQEDEAARRLWAESARIVGLSEDVVTKP